MFTALSNYFLNKNDVVLLHPLLYESHQLQSIPFHYHSHIIIFFSEKLLFLCHILSVTKKDTYGKVKKL